MSQENSQNDVWAVIPIKRFSQAKSRLSPILNAREREQLSLSMLEDVLIATSQANFLAGILVATCEPQAIALAQKYSVEIFDDTDSSGLCETLEMAGKHLIDTYKSTMLVILGDVPLISANEIDTLIENHDGLPAVSLVPATNSRGTNALLCTPPDAIVMQFGENSLAAHKTAALDMGIEPIITSFSGIGLDLDNADDLLEFNKYKSQSNTARLLDEITSADRSSGLTQNNDNLEVLMSMDVGELMQSAATIRDQGFGNIVSYSKKVFIPLTQLCRNVCHYCTFTKPPKAGQSAYMQPDKILKIAREGQFAGCKEALFTLGDKPELRFRAAREELKQMGYTSTIDYVAAMADLVFAETGLMPHINPGVMNAREISKLKASSVSMGLMLESSSDRLGEKGGPHYGSPDKVPAARLESIRQAGVQNVAITSGVLIGIGETRDECISSLLALRDLHQQYGHIQEIIVQNFRAKQDTKMANAPEPSTDYLLWAIAMARHIFGPEMSIQAPPNLSPGQGKRMIDAGINDWGGISPITPDFVNPEAPWPQIDTLDDETAQAGKVLVERLAIYPNYIFEGEKWLPAKFRSPIFEKIDTQGYVRTDNWICGGHIPPPQFKTRLAAPSTNTVLETILSKAGNGLDLTHSEVETLFSVRDRDFDKVCAAADGLRREISGDDVTYVVTRNINYTNICYFKCGFCAFSKGKKTESLRGTPYDLDMGEILRRVEEAKTRGGTEVCMQGGIHPSYTGNTYLDICRSIKHAWPDMHIHAFSPLEVWHGAETLGLSLTDFLIQLRDAGLGSLPGTAAEILDDEVRDVICGDKINTARWGEVIMAAHDVGLKSTSTIMFGHVERVKHWARHLLLLRDIQKETGGITEFVPLPFVHMEAPFFLKGAVRKGPTFREAVLMHAVPRLALGSHIKNIQTSWTKMGSAGAKICLNAGSNDLGGTLMNESISRAAGSSHGQEMPPEMMEKIIAEMGRTARQRTTLYTPAPMEAKLASFNAPPLSPIVNTPLVKSKSA